MLCFIINFIIYNWKLSSMHYSSCSKYLGLSDIHFFRAFVIGHRLIYFKRTMSEIKVKTLGRISLLIFNGYSRGYSLTVFIMFVI